MKRLFRFALYLLLIAFVAIQFYRPPRTNPPVDAQHVMQAPPQVQSILDRSCNDCHTNNTTWPWYTNIAPVSWFTIDHVNEAREELSFSEFGTYAPKKADHKLEEICEMVEKGEMPLREYVWLHPSARLSEADKRTLCEWAESERARLRR